MTWDQLDLEGRLWTLPAQSTKAKRRHEVPLSDLALEIVTSIPRREDTVYVFTTTGRTPISGFSRAKGLIDATVAKRGHTGQVQGPVRLSGNPWPFEQNWRFHDLRRTVATRLEDDLGIAKPLISAILNHAEAGATAVYTKGQLREQKLAAMQAWGKYLTKVVGGLR